MAAALFGTIYDRPPRRLTKFKCRQRTLKRLQVGPPYRGDIQVPTTKIWYFVVPAFILTFWAAIVVMSVRIGSPHEISAPRKAQTFDRDSLLAFYGIGIGVGMLFGGSVGFLAGSFFNI